MWTVRRAVIGSGKKWKTLRGRVREQTFYHSLVDGDDLVSCEQLICYSSTCIRDVFWGSPTRLSAAAADLDSVTRHKVRWVLGVLGKSAVSQWWNESRFSRMFKREEVDEEMLCTLRFVFLFRLAVKQKHLCFVVRWRFTCGCYSIPTQDWERNWLASWYRS